MVEITDAAAQMLEQALDGQDSPPDHAFRLSAGENGEITLGHARKEDGDVQLNNGDRAVVFVDSAVADALDNHTLDVEEAEDGVRLLVRVNG